VGRGGEAAGNLHGRKTAKKTLQEDEQERANPNEDGASKPRGCQRHHRGAAAHGRMKCGPWGEGLAQAGKRGSEGDGGGGAEAMQIGGEGARVMSKGLTVGLTSGQRHRVAPPRPCALYSLAPACSLTRSSSRPALHCPFAKRSRKRTRSEWPDKTVP